MHLQGIFNASFSLFAFLTIGFLSQTVLLADTVTFDGIGGGESQSVAFDQAWDSIIAQKEDTDPTYQYQGMYATGIEITSEVYSESFPGYHTADVTAVVTYQVGDPWAILTPGDKQGYAGAAQPYFAVQRPAGGGVDGEVVVQWYNKTVTPNRWDPVPGAVGTGGGVRWTILSTAAGTTFDKRLNRPVGCVAGDDGRIILQKGGTAAVTHDFKW